MNHKKTVLFFLQVVVLFFWVFKVEATVSDQDSSPFITSNSVKIEPDLHTGSFVYSYPIEVPPGRNGMAPQLAVTYNSANKEVASQVGYGWSLSIPTIERVSRYGADDLYNKNIFSSTLSGELEDVSLVDSSHGDYGAKADDGSFLNYVYNSDESWTVTDKKGVVYTFGATDDDRLSDPSDTTHVFRWMLSSIQDADGNNTVYSYVKDGNQVYPSAINYTGHNSDVGIFDVVFTLDSRSDTSSSYASGFLVSTNKRISDIDVEVSGTTVRHYDLDYTNGDNSIRSLLASITDTGTAEDGTQVTKPATSFTYTTSPKSWTEDTSFAGLPVVIAGTGSGSLGVYVFDVNGDGFPDVVKARYGQAYGVYINNGDNTWTEDTTITVPLDFAGPVAQDMGVRVFDVNGDGYQDLVYARMESPSSTWAVYLNNGDGTGWTQNTAITIPTGFSTSGNDYGTRAFDVDGDGLDDIVRYRDGEPTTVYINNGDGTGWTEDTNYTIPVAFVTSGGLDNGVRTFDVNGDGLQDLVYGRYTSTTSSATDSAVYINNGNGTGWTQDTNYTLPQMFIGPVRQDMGMRPMDVNGDGLMDLVYSRYLTSTNLQYDAVYINNGNGTGWTEDTSATVPMHFTIGSDVGVRQVDVNSDGLADILYSRSVGSTQEALYLADGDPADLLSTIANDQGGSTTVTYKSKDEAKGNLSFPVLTANTITTDDGLGNSATTTYDYSDGDYYYASEYDRKFSGFAEVSVTDAAGNVTVKYFHQGNDTNSAAGESADDISKLQKMYREENYDNAGHLYRTVLHSWTNFDLGNDRDFVYENQSLELLYDADTDHIDKATTNTYDTNSGNLTEQKNWGRVIGSDDASFVDVDTSDNILTDYTYADWSSSTDESAYPASKKITDDVGTVYQEILWSYDTLASGLVSNGHVTTESHWVSGTTYTSTTSTYDSYGFRDSVTDSLGYTTTFTPDSASMYVASKTDPLKATISYTYDYATGKVKQLTDQNGFSFTTAYDGFGRPTQSDQPDPLNPSTSVTKTIWSYDDTSVPVSVHQTDSFDATHARESYSYFDGFGRVIQQRTEAQTDYNVTDTVYDELGRVESSSLPYNQAGFAYSGATTTPDLYTTLTYDPLGRVLTATNVKGVVTNSYEDWIKTEVDANGKTKTSTNDAYDRLVSVGENSGTSTYTTSYSWNLVGNLLQITDAEGSLRAFTYDGVGHRLTAEDLHRPLDKFFGTWIYTYDNNGNLQTSLSPNAITTTYTYDALNRVLSEDADSTAATDITYTYDSCTNGLGKLCSASVSDGATTTSNNYDALGNISDETKTINTVNYITGHTYDRQGQLSSLSYPDSSTATFILDDSGHVIEADFVDPHGSSTKVASGITYGANDKVNSILYGNGVISSYTYNSSNLYRLENIKTTVSAGSNLEDYQYTYDAVGNLTNLVDNSSLYSSLTMTYSYDDLYRLQLVKTTNAKGTINKTWKYSPTGNIVFSSDAGLYKYEGYQKGRYANPHAATDIGGIVQRYDHNGNVTRDSTWVNSWNWRNQLIQSFKKGTTLTYFYDHQGKRVYDSSTAGPSHISVNSYYNIDDTTTERQIPLGSFGIVATSREASGAGASSMVYHHRDHLGGMHVDTDDAGAMVEFTIYKPYGNPIRDYLAGTYKDNKKFTGKELDADTGWYYFGARYYSGNFGQFLSQDSVALSLGNNSSTYASLKDPQSLNAYAYARNNPIRMIDPDGNSFLDTLNTIQSVTRFVGDTLSFGAFSTVFDNAGAAGQRMAREGVNASTVTNTAIQTIGGGIVMGAGGAATGALQGGGTLVTKALGSKGAGVAAGALISGAQTGIQTLVEDRISDGHFDLGHAFDEGANGVLSSFAGEAFTHGVLTERSIRVPFTLRRDMYQGIRGIHKELEVMAGNTGSMISDMVLDSNASSSVQNQDTK